MQAKEKSWLESQQYMEETREKRTGRNGYAIGGGSVPAWAEECGAT
jgi:hypothetical protein